MLILKIHHGLQHSFTALMDNRDWLPPIEDYVPRQLYV